MNVQAITEEEFLAVSENAKEVSRNDFGTMLALTYEDPNGHRFVVLSTVCGKYAAVRA